MFIAKVQSQQLLFVEFCASICILEKKSQSADLDPWEGDGAILFKANSK